MSKEALRKSILHKLRNEAVRNNLSVFAVVADNKDGTGNCVYSAPANNKHNEAVKLARRNHMAWESAHGHDPHVGKRINKQANIEYKPHQKRVASKLQKQRGLITKYPSKDKKTDLPLKESIKKRLKSAATSMYYAGMPPSELSVGRHTLMKGHHTAQEVYDLADNPDEGIIRSFSKSYNKWKPGLPNKEASACYKNNRKETYIMKEALAKILNSAVIDQPKGSYKHFGLKNYPLKGIKYTTDYGYLPGHTGEDKAELDFFRGTGKKQGTLLFHRPDVKGGKETKTYFNMSTKELSRIRKDLAPILLDHTAMSQKRFAEELKKFKDG